MNPSYELLFAYIRKANARVEEAKLVVSILRHDLADLKRENYTLRKENRELRASRDKWKAKAAEKQRVIRILRANVRQAREARKLWRHRAMIRQEEASGNSERESGRRAA